MSHQTHRVVPGNIIYYKRCRVYENIIQSKTFMTQLLLAAVLNRNVVPDIK